MTALAATHVALVLVACLLFAMFLHTRRVASELAVRLLEEMENRDRAIAERNGAWDAFAKVNSALSAVSPCPECVAREAAMAGAP